MDFYPLYEYNHIVRGKYLWVERWIMDEHADCADAALTSAGRVADDTQPLAMVLAPARTVDLFPETAFDELGCMATYADTIDEAKAICARDKIDLMVLPLRMDDRNVLPFIRDVLMKHEDQAIVVVSQSDQIDDAAEAMRLGAQDCIFIPFTENRLKKTIRTVLQKQARRLGRQVSHGQKGQPLAPRPAPTPPDTALSSVPATSEQRHGMVLSDLSMKPVLRALDKIASSLAPVFINGETGTGKEVLARAIHAESRRSSNPFVVIDCARLTSETLGQEVFADHRHTSDGAARTADGRTLFLDEIARTDLAVQKQLLRFLDSGEIVPQGTLQASKVDTRIICSSTENPRAEIKAGRLRADLFYRLHVVPITLPALRDRGDDILAIAHSKLLQTSRHEGRKFQGFSASAADILTQHSWPGNIRQLINVIWNIVLHHDAEWVTADMLPDEILTDHQAPGDQTLPAPAWTASGLIGRPLAEIERIAIEETIRSQGGSIPRAAQVLGVSPSTIYRKRDGWADL
ncbi:sigma-54 dependent transcriptional regulator [uncultured Aliiroseovarius sp.]|uniref:sigma-54-dependent transcriptional regulator n=1 Tax=uncultured Aliiroseovarius sp. TaxID=1658783 RepID=UPI00259965BA|nr:sigma-54 dependent transcriptional regulator [uncultured Aliiroseovarius sp.]